jgi:branched-chain amino acid aminotransferase
MNSAKIFEINIPFSQTELESAQIEIVRKNKLKSCYLRPIVYLGSEKMGLSPNGCSVHVSIAAWPWGTYLGDDGLSNGIRVKTSSFSRHHVNSSMVRAKACGYYINSILAHQEVSKNGYDEALMLDTDGYVSEGAGENLFIVKKNIVYTTDLTTCLDGITRDTVFELSHELGIEIKEKRLTRDEVYCADEAFFTGTAAEITPIKELDDRIIGNGKKGKVTEKLQNLFFDVVAGKTPKFSNWLSEI